MRTRLVAALTIAALVMTPGSASAWGIEVHKFIMSRAISLLPREIRPYFEKYQSSIVEHAGDPDLWRNVGWLEESPRHFVDMDAYGPYPFTELPHDYDEAVRWFRKAADQGDPQAQYNLGKLYFKGDYMATDMDVPSGSASNGEKGDAYPDPKAGNPKIVVFDVKPDKKLAKPVTLAQIKADPAFAGWDFLRIGRLSVVPVPEAMWKRIEALSKP